MIFLILIGWCVYLFCKESKETVNELRGVVGKEAHEHEAEIIAEEILNDPTTHIIEIGEVRILTFMVNGYQEVITLNQKVAGGGQENNLVRQALKLRRPLKGHNNTQAHRTPKLRYTNSKIREGLLCEDLRATTRRNGFKPALEALIKMVERRFVYLTQKNSRSFDRLSFKE